MVDPYLMHVPYRTEMTHKIGDSLRFSNLTPILLFSFQVVQGRVKANVG